MKAPQIIMIILFTISITGNLLKHGEPKDGDYNFWLALLSAGIEFALLKWGGFF